MRYKLWLYALVAVFCSGTLCSGAIAEETVANRAAKVQSALETLNTLGRDCETGLQAEEKIGSTSEACKEYLDAQKEYSAFIDEECSSLLRWYHSTQQVVTAGAIERAELEQLFRDTRAVRDVCGPERLKSYEFATTPQ